MEKDIYIKDLFDSIAKKYDSTNDFISFGLHKAVKKNYVKTVKKLYNKTPQIIDLACGTGDISILLAKTFPDSKVYAVDFSKNMLEIAKKSAVGIENIEFIEADILKLPFDNDFFDISTISFGLRNVACYKSTLLEMKRIVKNEGIISSLDTNNPDGILKAPYNTYFQKIMPKFSALLHNHNGSLDYLAKSSKNYDTKEICAIMQEIGLKELKIKNYLFGTMQAQFFKKA